MRCSCLYGACIWLVFAAVRAFERLEGNLYGCGCGCVSCGFLGALHGTECSTLYMALYGCVAFQGCFICCDSLGVSCGVLAVL